MLRLFAISGFLLIVGWTTPSSAEIVGNLFECKPVAMQKLGMDGKFQDMKMSKSEKKILKRLIFDETTGILRLGKGYPPIKFTVLQIGQEQVSSRSIGVRDYGEGQSNAEKFIRAFYIEHWNSGNSFGEGKPIREKYPFYFLDNQFIFTGHCDKL